MNIIREVKPVWTLLCTETRLEYKMRIFYVENLVRLGWTGLHQPVWRTLLNLRFVFRRFNKYLQQRGFDKPVIDEQQHDEFGSRIVQV